MQTGKNNLKKIYSPIIKYLKLYTNQQKVKNIL